MVANPTVSNLYKNEELPKTKAVLNQSVADLSKAYSIIHQVHWYMRGRGFLYLHPKMDEYMDTLNGFLDEISERLITIGGAPYSTLKEFDDNSQLVEEPGSYDLSMEDRIERLIGVYAYLSELFQKGLDDTASEGDDVSNDIFVQAKADADKNLWMLKAEANRGARD
ncbi:Dps family protein [Streptococcus sp. DD12]|uniref:Dps family protein n=1 Tax=Streptococcus sp. DD12 TaxID=1777880 RepID=UPI00082EF414